MQITYIIGTDTGIGKTYSCCQIMKYLASNNQLVTALKPISSGISQCEYGLLHEDVYQLFQNSNYSLSFEQINPFSFEQAVAPHIAAELMGKPLNVISVNNKVIQTISQCTKVNHILIEGIGGLMVPLNRQETYLDLLNKLKYPIILIVGMRIGCLNHTLLTETILKNSGLGLAGWIANGVDPQMAAYTENLDYLKYKLSAPLLGTIPFQGHLQPTIQFKELFKCH